MFKKIINTALQGFFWILPILLIIFIANWLFEKAEILTHILPVPAHALLAHQNSFFK
jgi:hypothetical protein